MDRRRILLVEDKTAFREALAIALQQSGYAVSSAENGRHALGTLEFQLPDILVLDLSMPEIDGLTLLGRLRGNPAWRHLPVIVLSARSDEESRSLAAKFQVSDYLVKAQFSIQSLLKRIGEVLDEEANHELDTLRQTARPAGVQQKIIRGFDFAKLSTGTEILNKGDFGGRLRAADVTTLTPLVEESCVRERIATRSANLTLHREVATILATDGVSPIEQDALKALLSSNQTLCDQIIRFANCGLFGAPLEAPTIESLILAHGLPFLRACAIAIGIVQSFSADQSKDESLFKFWQHALAVSGFLISCGKSQSAEQRSKLLLIGLCHDLGRFVMEREFPADFTRADAVAYAHGRSIYEVWQTLFGASGADIFSLAIAGLKLPEALTDPIREYLGAPTTEATPNHFVRALEFATYFANGCDMAVSSSDLVRPITKTEAITVLDTAALASFDSEAFRRTTYALTASLLGIEPSVASISHLRNDGPRSTIWYARHVSFLAVEPLSLAVKQLVHIRPAFRLPLSIDELKSFSALVVATPSCEEDMFSLDRTKEFSRPGANAGAPLYFSLQERPEEGNSDLAFQPVPISIGQLRERVIAASN